MDIHTVIKYIWAFFLSIGPILGYIPQFIDIKRTRHYQGFSSIICFILLTSNILRILSYFVKSFDIFLLLQSVFMVIVQLLMLHLIVKLSTRGILPQNDSIPPNRPSNIDNNRSYFASFWAWKSFFDYILFLSLFTFLFSLVVLNEKFLFPSKIVQVGFLYVATSIESTLCMPQAWTNWKNHSTFGLNNSLVLSWVSGDIFKLSYFIYSKSETAFIVCAVIQIFVDFIIMLQIIYFKWFNIKEENAAEMAEKTLIISSEVGESRSSSTKPLNGAALVIEEKS